MSAPHSPARPKQKIKTDAKAAQKGNSASICEKDTAKKDILQDQGIRLNKAIAEAGICSRRKADELIFSRRVKIDGEIVANPGVRILPGMLIEVDGQVITAPEKYDYIMLNKPIHCVSTMGDPQKRQTVLELLPENLRKKRLCPAGRLDYFSEGLLLLTNDGAAIQHLCHPRCHQSKIYEAIVRGEIVQETLQAMRKGMTLEDGTKLLPVKVEARSLPDGKIRLVFTLLQGVNRQIRRMCAQAGWTVLKLKRVAQGNLRLGNLAPGKWRKLTNDEIEWLMALK